MVAIDEDINELLGIVEKKGYVSYEDINIISKDDLEVKNKLFIFTDSEGIDVIDDSKDKKERIEETKEEYKATEKIDDPVRMYLVQMGQIPLLTREEETSIAERIESTKIRSMNKLFSCQSGLNYVVDLFKRVKAGDVAVDRVISADKIEDFPYFSDNVETLEMLAERNKEQFRKFSLRRSSKFLKDRLNKRIRTTLDNVVPTLVWEMGLDSGKKGWRGLMDYVMSVFSELEKYEKMLSNNLSGVKRREVEKKKRDLVRNKVLESYDEFKARLKDFNKRYSEYEKAKREMAGGNLRLVVSIAKRYRNRGLGFLDLIQEGNKGLMTAVDRYEYRRGYKFSTFSTWWIKQGITRAIADQGRTIRIPVHMIETIGKLRSVSRELVQEKGGEPTLEELSYALGISEEDVKKVIKVSKHPLSIDMSIKGSHDKNTLRDSDGLFGEFLEDKNEESPVDNVLAEQLQNRIDDVLDTLEFRQREIIKMRYGLGYPFLTLEEIGGIFKITRERVRQIEFSALRKLQHPVRSRKLEGFVDQKEVKRIRGRTKSVFMRVSEPVAEKKPQIDFNKLLKSSPLIDKNNRKIIDVISPLLSGDERYDNFLIDKVFTAGFLKQYKCGDYVKEDSEGKFFAAVKDGLVELLSCKIPAKILRLMGKPPREELVRLYEDNTMAEIGEIYGRPNHHVREWFIHDDIKRKTCREIWESSQLEKRVLVGIDDAMSIFYKYCPAGYERIWRGLAKNEGGKKVSDFNDLIVKRKRGIGYSYSIIKKDQKEFDFAFLKKLMVTYFNDVEDLRRNFGDNPEEIKDVFERMSKIIADVKKKHGKRSKWFDKDYRADGVVQNYLELYINHG